MHALKQLNFLTHVLTIDETKHDTSDWLWAN